MRLWQLKTSGPGCLALDCSLVSETCSTFHGPSQYSTFESPCACMYTFWKCHKCLLCWISFSVKSERAKQMQCPNSSDSFMSLPMSISHLCSGFPRHSLKGGNARACTESLQEGPATTKTLTRSSTTRIGLSRYLSTNLALL